MSGFQGRSRVKGLNRLRQGMTGRGPRVQGLPRVETLEGRVLLATLDIVSGTTGSMLTYLADPRVTATNTLSIQVTTLVPQNSLYTFTDATDPIALGAGAKQLGWQSINANTVVGPTNTVNQMLIDTRDGPDTVNILATEAPIDIVPTNGGAQVVNIGNAGSVQAINGIVNVTNPNATTALTVDDSADQVPRFPNLIEVPAVQASISGLAPQPILFANLSALTINGGSGNNLFTVTSPGTPDPTPFPIKLNTGTGSDQVNITSNSEDLTINGQGGSDLVDVGLQPSIIGSLHDIVGPVTVIGPAGSIDLRLDDSGENLDSNSTVTATTVTGLAPATISFPGPAGQSPLRSLHILGPTGANSFNVQDIAAPTSIDGGPNSAVVDVAATTQGLTLNTSGSSTINLGNPTNGVQSIVGPVTITNSNGQADLTISDRGDTQARSALISSFLDIDGSLLRSVSGLAPAGILFTPAQLRSLTIDTGSAANTLVVDFSIGNAIPPGGTGLVYNGGAGSDTLTLQGGAGFQSETIAANGPGAGIIALDTTTITFSGLKPINDLVPAAVLNFFAPSVSQAIGILNGPTFKNLLTNQITSLTTPPGFELVNFANKTAVLVRDIGNGNTPTDQSVALNFPIAATGLTSLNVVTGGGNDTINLTAQPPGVTTVLAVGNGNNSVIVRSSGLLGTLGTTLIGGVGTGIDTLTYDANGLAANITPLAVSAGTGVVSQQTNVAFSGLDRLQVVNSIDPPLTTTPVTINAMVDVPIAGATVASFVDTDPNGQPGDYSASINWGDGTTTPADTIAHNGSGGFNVLGTHTYRAGGSFPVVVTINDLGSSFVLQTRTGPVAVTTNGGARAIVASNAQVQGGVVTPFAATGIAVAATEGRIFNGGVASFTTDLIRANASSFTATINWGDKTPDTAGTITQPLGPGTPLLVSGTHTYNAPGSFTVNVTIHSPDGRSVAATSTATVAADLTVYDLLDDTNPGSLRHALLEVNAGLGSVVTFNIPGTAPFGIAPLSLLPALTKPATIDATTQPGYQGKPLVVLTGSKLAGDSNNGLVFEAGSEKSTVKGLVINGFSNIGISLENRGGNTIQSNFIGTNFTGGAAIANFQGLLILGSSDNQILDNLISGNRSAGIQIYNTQAVTDPTQTFVVSAPAARNIVRGNRIGTNADGTGAVGNGQGIFINDAPDNIIGGSAPTDGNIISGNRSVGVQVLGPDASGTMLLSNAIGFDRTRSQALPNGSDVFVFASASNMSVSSIQDGNTVQASGVRSRPLTDGPTVQAAVASPANGNTIDTLTLTFTMYLDRARASLLQNYQVVVLGTNGRALRTIPVASATYNGIFRTVVLVLGSPVSRNSTIQLLVVGTGPQGLTDTSGNPLDGNQTRARISTGSDNVTIFRDGVSQLGIASAIAVSKVRKHGHKLGHLHAHAHAHVNFHKHRLPG